MMITPVASDLLFNSTSQTFPYLENLLLRSSLLMSLGNPPAKTLKNSIDIELIIILFSSNSCSNHHAIIKTLLTVVDDDDNIINATLKARLRL